MSGGDGPGPALAGFFAAQARFFARATTDPEAATDALLREHPGWEAPRSRVRLYADLVGAHVQEVLARVFPRCRDALPPAAWDALVRRHDATRPARHWELNALGEAFPALLERAAPEVPPWLPALARLEWAIYEVYRRDVEVPERAPRLAPNPTLVALELPWRLCAHAAAALPRPTPEAGDEVALLWRRRDTGLTSFMAANPRALLALKVALEGLSPAEAAARAGVPQEQVEAALTEHVAHDLLIASPGPGAGAPRGT